jgi:hypothetical protein
MVELVKITGDRILCKNASDQVTFDSNYTYIRSNGNGTVNVGGYMGAPVLTSAYGGFESNTNAFPAIHDMRVSPTVSSSNNLFRLKNRRTRQYVFTYPYSSTTTQSSIEAIYYPTEMNVTYQNYTTYIPFAYMIIVASKNSSNQRYLQAALSTDNTLPLNWTGSGYNILYDPSHSASIEYYLNNSFSNPSSSFWIKTSSDFTSTYSGFPYFDYPMPTFRHIELSTSPFNAQLEEV